MHPRSDFIFLIFVRPPSLEKKDNLDNILADLAVF